MENPKVIFPDVEFRQDDKIAEISTHVRVAKEDGTGFYFWHVIETSKVVPNNLKEMLCRFNNMVYCAMVLGKLNESLVTMHGNPVFRMDDSKETERERMKRIMLGKLGA